jgi:hypothetical protein
MKKIQLLQTKHPDESKYVENEQQPIFPKKDIPVIQFNTQNLEGLEDKVQKLKLCNYQSDFLTEINKILYLYDDSELKYNAKFVLFVMNEVEKFILKKKSGEAKKNLVVEVCKKYFNDDSDLVLMVIDLVFEKLQQVKFFKRQGLKLIRFFAKIKRNQQ